LDEILKLFLKHRVLRHIWGHGFVKVRDTDLKRRFQVSWCEVHNYFIEILGFDEKSSEIKSNLQKNKEYDELDRFFKLPQCHQNNENAHKKCFVLDHFPKSR
jgi:hypothetical protein